MIWVYWAAFLVFSSMAEAVFWSRHKGTNPKGLRKDNAHLWLFMMRVGPLFMAWQLAGMEAAVFMVFSFSFFHDGIYYHGRHWLDKEVYKKGFFDTSTTSTALYSPSLIMRTATAAAGLLIFLLN